MRQHQTNAVANQPEMFLMSYGHYGVLGLFVFVSCFVSGVFTHNYITLHDELCLLRFAGSYLELVIFILRLSDRVHNAQTIVRPDLLATRTVLLHFA